MSLNKPSLPTIDAIRKKTFAKLGRDPCEWQAKVAREILRAEKDVICVAPTGAGKTLTFWMPLLFREDGIQIVVTPLNILGTQSVAELELDIEDGKYRAIVINPELLMKEGGGFERLWKNQDFASRIISIIWDEAHCVSLWSAFRTEYRDAYRLRYLLPHVRFVLASATLPEEIQIEVMRILIMSCR
ncbi:hypothetical protein POSPLADRAFT_1143987 [Postia placenta MAD-698-R-SB12]|uniref:Helicase ATP-binding domain-containing protein n=2 Tax=Postia placenta MAD-698-R-SB12 TaxID=670580 RepID=A0A1X6MZN4_9APHY|nr:hypothetical protein POSPLADRAFT_1143987 [Postia placenta MAD-698-R-SB12]OSX61702.1 hypothetical protein POSPLADRAFT_1143987 [Postia placenta MAD-698-R-SB12]